MTSSDQPLSSEPLSGENPEDAATIDTFQTIARQLRSCNVKFLRVAWCDTANVIRAKAAYVPRLEGVFKDGVALCVGNQVRYTTSRDALTSYKHIVKSVAYEIGVEEEEGEGGGST